MKLKKEVVWRLNVIPGCSRFELPRLESLGKEIRVKVCSPALKGKANNELFKEVGGVFNSRAKTLREKAGGERF